MRIHWQSLLAPFISSSCEEHQRIKRRIRWMGFGLLATLAFPMAAIWMSGGNHTVVALALCHGGLLLLMTAGAMALLDRVVSQSLARLQAQQTALRESEARYRRILDSTTDYMFTVHVRQGQAFESVHSAGSVAITGYTPEEYRSNPDLWHQIVHHSDRPAILVHATNSLAGLQTAPLEYRIHHKNGSLRWLRTTAVLRYDQAGQLTAFDGLVSDVTARKQAEQALRASEERFRTLLEEAPAAITLVRQGRCLYRNKTSLRLFGLEQADEPLVQAIARRQDATALAQARLRTSASPGPELAPESPNEFETKLRRRDGSEIPVHAAIAEVKLEDGPATIAFVSDITKRHLAEEAVHRTSEQLRALSGRLQSLREEERTRIAREIHDHLGQLLTALKLELRSLERKSAAVGDIELRNALAAKVASARQLADETINSVQKIAAELRPGALDRLGLGAAIQLESEAFAARSGIHCQFILPEKLPPLPQSHTTAMFRIFQELLTNIGRHSQASQVAIRMDCDTDHLSLEVSDDGVGIQPAQLQSPSSLGLLGMHERASQLGGQLTFALALKRGTRVKVRLPLRKVEA